MRRAAALFSLLLFLPTLAAAIDLGGLLNNLSKIDKNTVNTVKQAVVPADEQQEQQYGYSAAATLLGAARPIQNADVQNYVNKVGLWVALHSDRPNLPWHFAVVDSNDIDAFAAPYGYVFITRGLLFHMRSEAELAGVLGHEISHVVLKHHLKALQQAAQMQ
ncbi:MAG TPA: M48 family metalloprotease, partial [Gammaproteobacteria bacterium]|nr:M48 family metalloprotease [Gammaproteobacteria bacterium]